MNDNRYIFEKGSSEFNSYLCEYINAKGDLNDFALRSEIDYDIAREIAVKNKFAIEYRIYKNNYNGLIADRLKENEKLLNSILSDSINILDYTTNMDFILLDQICESILTRKEELSQMPIEKVVNLYFKIEEANNRRIELLKDKADEKGESGLTIIMPNMTDFVEQVRKEIEPNILESYIRNTN